MKRRCAGSSVLRPLAWLGAYEARRRMRPSSSPDPRRRLVVAYDVADDGRRERVARVLEDYGVRVQYSVFECVLGRAQYRQFRRVLAERIDPAEEDRKSVV